MSVFRVSSSETVNQLRADLRTAQEENRRLAEKHQHLTDVLNAVGKRCNEAAVKRDAALAALAKAHEFITSWAEPFPPSKAQEILSDTTGTAALAEWTALREELRVARDSIRAWIERYSSDVQSLRERGAGG